MPKTRTRFIDILPKERGNGIPKPSRTAPRQPTAKVVRIAALRVGLSGCPVRSYSPPRYAAAVSGEIASQGRQFDAISIAPDGNRCASLPARIQP